MPPYLALALCLCFVLALFVLDRRWRQTASIGAWIPLIWALILGSRPITTWYSPSSLNSLEVLYEGSPVDRALYLALIAAGIAVLIARRFTWRQLGLANPWVIVFYAYLGISLFWSDYPFIAFKRWIKDLGNLVMILIVVSEGNPLAAGKGLFIRASYVLVPLGVVVMKYFPEFGRYYDVWGRAYLSSIATDKNMLGMTLTVLTLALMWGFIDAGNEKPGGGKKLERAVYALLVTMVIWLLRIADCATASACITVGVMSMMVLGLPSVRKNVRVFITLGVVSIGLLAVPDVRDSILQPIVDILGRKTDFTGRDVVWRAVLAEDINPIIGVGSYSFWMGDRIDRALPGVDFGTNEAHNAYLEIYLNVGLVGVALYLAILASCTIKVMRQLTCAQTSNGDRFLLSFVIVTVLYGATEAVVRANLIWFGLLLVASRASLVEKMQRAQASNVRVRPGSDPYAHLANRPVQRTDRYRAPQFLAQGGARPLRGRLQSGGR
jgi:exopolysaccharide production protein ExoQ